MGRGENTSLLLGRRSRDSLPDPLSIKREKRTLRVQKGDILMRALSDQVGEEVRYLEYPQGSVLVVAGPPGVGKSSFLERVKHSAHVISADEIEVEVQKKYPAWDYKQRAQEVTNIIPQRVLAAQKQGENVIIDAPAVFKKQIQAYQSVGEVHSLMMYCDDPYEYLEGRNSTGRFIDESAIKKYHAVWNKALIAAEEEENLQGYQSIVVMDRGAIDRVRRISFS